MRQKTIRLTANYKLTSQIAMVTAAAIGLASCNTAGDKKGAADALDLTGQPVTTQQQGSVDLRAFCPKAIVRAGTETLRIYEPLPKRSAPETPKTIRFQATLTEVVRECTYSGDMINIRVGIKGRIINGPTAATGTVELPVRIAATNTKKEVPYTNLNKIAVAIQPGANYAGFSYIENNISVLKPAKNDLIIYVGFDEGPTDQKVR